MNSNNSFGLPPARYLEMFDYPSYETAAGVDQCADQPNVKYSFSWCNLSASRKQHTSTITPDDKAGKLKHLRKVGRS